MAASDKNSVIIKSDISEWPSEQIRSNVNFSGSYVLKFKEQSTIELEKAFQRVYGNAVPTMKAFHMSLWDATETVKFTSLGTTPMEMCVPIPNNIKGNTIHVVVLDEDGQLEKLGMALETIDEKDYIRFSTNYFSTFAIYAMGEDGNVVIENGNVEYTSLSNKKDYSPNTGDTSIHPKWFVATGLTALAIALIVSKPKKKRRFR